MKIFVQWTTNPTQDWTEIDSADWNSLPKKSEPVGGENIDALPGWIYAINCQGCRFSGDHYSITDIAPDEVLIASWTDDIDDRSVDEFHGTLAFLKDPAFDNDLLVKKINTRQQFNVFANATIFDRIVASPSTNRSIDIFDNYIIPGETKTLSEYQGTELETLYKNSASIRHGINVTDGLAQNHLDIQTPHGWREWIK